MLTPILCNLMLTLICEETMQPPSGIITERISFKVQNHIHPCFCRLCIIDSDTCAKMQLCIKTKIEPEFIINENIYYNMMSTHLMKLHVIYVCNYFSQRYVHYNIITYDWLRLPWGYGSGHWSMDWGDHRFCSCLSHCYNVDKQWILKDKYWSKIFQISASVKPDNILVQAWDTFVEIYADRSQFVDGLLTSCLCPFTYTYD